MPELQKYAGRSTRYTCPGCGRTHCFTRYLDDDGKEIDPTCGICDHASSCSYHLPPREFYRLHPERKPATDWRYQKVVIPHSRSNRESPSKTLPTATYFIPPEVVLRSVRYNVYSDFVKFLLTILDPVVVEDLIKDYQLGVTSKRDVIFFQLDVNGSCRTGKIMRYDPETGHRIKDERQPNRINWVHSLMKVSGRLPNDWQLTQCLYGEHLLRQYPNKVVALVESEKTACVCAGLMPRFLWLATGGKSQINERLLVLRGRKVVAFPDVDGYDEWCRKLSEFPLDIRVSPILQQNATAEDREAHIDIADWLIRYMFVMPGSDRASQSGAFLKAAQFLDPEFHGEVQGLIQDLGLEFVREEKVE